VEIAILKSSRESNQPQGIEGRNNMNATERREIKEELRGIGGRICKHGTVNRWGEEEVGIMFKDGKWMVYYSAPESIVSVSCKDRLLKIFINHRNNNCCYGEGDLEN
jgi:hypothetical protein